MTEIIQTAISIFLAFTAVLIGVALIRFLRAGPGKVSYLRRKNYGFWAWATGGLPKTDIGTTLHELEGLEVEAHKGRVTSVRQTRAVTSES